MLVNLIPSRYKDFVSFIKMFKQRMEGIGKRKDWEKFFVDFKKINKVSMFENIDDISQGKKKLMNTISMISESFSM